VISGNPARQGSRYDHLLDFKTNGARQATEH
jgi:hypothetical protein